MKRNFISDKHKKSYRSKNLNNLSRIFLSSLVIISIFVVLPIIVNFTKEKSLISKDFENNSKMILRKF